MTCGRPAEVVQSGVVAFAFEEDVSGAAFPVFGDVDVGSGPVGDSVFVGAGEEEDDICVLLDVAGLPEVGELEFSAGGLLCLSAELGDSEDGDLQVLGEVLEGSRVFADEFPSGSTVAGGGVDEADVVDEGGGEAVLAVEEACGGYEVSDGEVGSVVEVDRELPEVGGGCGHAGLFVGGGVAAAGYCVAGDVGDVGHDA